MSQRNFRKRLAHVGPEVWKKYVLKIGLGDKIKTKYINISQTYTNIKIRTIWLPTSTFTSISLTNVCEVVSYPHRDNHFDLQSHPSHMHRMGNIQLRCFPFTLYNHLRRPCPEKKTSHSNWILNRTSKLERRFIEAVKVAFRYASSPVQIPIV